MNISSDAGAYHSGKRRQPIRTLVVDDSSIAQGMICAFLEDQEDIEVVGTARNGLQAIEKVQTLCPELVLLDMQMPSMSGTEVAQQLRKRFPDVRVIVVTVYDDQVARMLCEACGVDGFVSKVRLPEISGEIRRIFRDPVLKT